MVKVIYIHIGKIFVSDTKAVTIVLLRFYVHEMTLRNVDWNLFQVETVKLTSTKTILV